MDDFWTPPEPDFDSDDVDWVPETLPATTLDFVAYEAALKTMREAPSTVTTFDKDRKVLVPWVWPATASGQAIEVKHIENTISKYNLELPFCLCVYHEDGEDHSRPATLRRKDGVLAFVCRLSKRACGYIAALDKFDPVRAPTAPIEELSGVTGYSFRYALLEMNEKLVRDLNLHHGKKAAGASRSEKGKSVVRGSFSHVKFDPYNSKRRAPMASSSRRFNPGQAGGSVPAVGLPPALMELVYALTSHGVPQAKLEEVTVACNKCKNIVYAPAKDFHACPE